MESVIHDDGGLHRLTKDLKEAAKTLSPNEARYLVDYYYLLQEDRIRAGHQVRQLEKTDEPHAVIAWLGGNVGMLEQQIARALGVYAKTHKIGRWAQSITGIGPIISAGLMAHIDLEPFRCAVIREPQDPTVTKKKKAVSACTEDKPHGPACRREKLVTAGMIWRFAGLDPTSTWNKGEKRPWNASLKTLTWKIGESFVKVSSHEKDFYGKLILQRKAYEQQHNQAGDYAQQAIAKLEKFRIGDDTDARIWYEGRLTVEQANSIFQAPPESRMGMAKKIAGSIESGVRMLPPGHIHARAKRWAVKLFLSHWHSVAFEIKFGEPPPRPYILSKEGGHAHEITAPNWPMSEE